MPLPVNFSDAILSESMNGKKRVHLTEITEGVFSVEDVTEYDQEGSKFGALEVNNLGKAANDLEASINMSVLTAGITIYVSASTGNDTTGNGSSEEPYKTINKALSVIPKNLNGFDAKITIASGTYPESVAILGFHGGTLEIFLSANITINSLEIQETTRVYLNSGTFRNLTISNTTGIPIVVYKNSLLESSNINIIVNGSVGYNGFEITDNSNFLSFATVTINNANNALKVYGSHFYTTTLAGSGNVVGILGDQGCIISYGSKTITATTEKNLGIGSIITNDIGVKIIISATAPSDTSALWVY